jgi:hypothetical protein
MPISERERHTAPIDIVCERPTGPRVSFPVNRGFLAATSRSSIFVFVKTKASAVVAEADLSATIILTCRLFGATLLTWHLILATMMMMGIGAETPPAQQVVYQGPGDVVSGASAFWGLRAYNAAYAAAQSKLINACLPLDALCTDINSDTSGNLSVSMLATLGCNNTTSICTVKTLYDQSAALACAGSTACDITQATAANRPTLVLAGAANGCPVTTLPCMAFVRASLQVLKSANTYTQAQPISVELVGIRTATFTSANRAILFGAGVAPFIQWTNSANTMSISAGTVQTLSVSDSSWHAVQGVWSNTVGSLSADGVTSTANNGTSTPAGVVDIGANANGSAGLDGKLTEAGIWPIAFSAGNISGLNSNAHTYWGF